MTKTERPTCGCRYREAGPPDWGMKAYDGIEFCPLHAKAQELAEALKQAIAEMNDEWYVAGGEDNITEPGGCSQCDAVFYGGDDERHGCIIGEWQALIADIDSGGTG